MELVKEKSRHFTATRNACKLCTPLGASLVFRGLKSTIPLLHGSQGCATYIRRYMISHYKEPVDISSSNFAEETAIFGGAENLKTALTNVISQYNPDIIGIASTCLSETIGDDVDAIIKDYIDENDSMMLPYLIHVSTPSYRGTHMDGFYDAIKAVVKEIVQSSGRVEKTINLIPGMWSPEDLRYIKELFQAVGDDYIMLPDYSETMDGPSWEEYHVIPPGGTSLIQVENMSASKATIEFGHSLPDRLSAGRWLEENFAVPGYQMGYPIGVKANDELMNLISKLTGKPMPEKYRQARGRLLDSYADAHKYVFEKRAVLYGEEDLVIAMAGFLREIGMIPVICATGAKSKKFIERLREVIPGMDELGVEAMTDVDFLDLEDKAAMLTPDLVIGNSKGYKLSKKLEAPLVRIGFPVHDRIGGQRLLHIGYHGTQQLFDRITNAIIEKKQETSPVGYTYM